MNDEFEWEALGLDEALALMEGFPAPWWVVGGWAIELYTGRNTREHADVDIGVRRGDEHLLREQLAGWDVRVAHGGRLEPWEPPLEPLRAGLWARSVADGPWQIEFQLASHEGKDWVYRRDLSIRMPLARAILRNREGIPYERPELVLLFKSKHLRERDELDFESVLPLLDSSARERLLAWLPHGHPWRSRLTGWGSGPTAATCATSTAAA